MLTGNYQSAGNFPSWPIHFVAAEKQTYQMTSNLADHGATKTLEPPGTPSEGKNPEVYINSYGMFWNIVSQLSQIAEYLRINIRTLTKL